MKHIPFTSSICLSETAIDNLMFNMSMAYFLKVTKTDFEYTLGETYKFKDTTLAQLLLSHTAYSQMIYQVVNLSELQKKVILIICSHLLFNRGYSIFLSWSCLKP